MVLVFGLVGSVTNTHASTVTPQTFRRGKMISTATAQIPKIKPSTVHRFFGYPLLCANSRHMMLSHVCTTRMVRSSVAGSRFDAKKPIPVK